MIKSNELRIGNKMKCEYGIGYACSLHDDGIFSIDIKGDSYSSEDIDIDPIPLTPEILEKAGFGDFTSLIASERGVTSEIIKFTIKHESRTYIVRPIGDVFVLNLHISDLEEIEFASFEYLHQLQNLYFALTGTELEINLNP